MDKSGKFQLFDIVKDPIEANDVKADFTEVAMRIEQNIKDWKANIQE